MKVLMFGWEFPPQVSGGLGTACYGMAGALVGAGQEIVFVMPRLSAPSPASPVRLIDASLEASEADQPWMPSFAERFAACPVASPLKPYLSTAAYALLLREKSLPGAVSDPSGLYGENLFAEVLRYGRAAAAIAADAECDIIHGHDWMTVFACLQAKEVCGRPYVFHVHATEYDRCGDGGDPTIAAIERCGMEMADAVIAVSAYTKSVLVQRYGIEPEKITVVHNAVTRREGLAALHVRKHDPEEKKVLFLGRITAQKGPEHFVAAAAEVLAEMPEVIFVMAGAGDMLPHVIEMVEEKGLAARFRFPGFLTGEEVEQAFADSDLYVMPSVSEPFGIAPLEAMMYDVPVIISSASGVSEILRHAITVDVGDAHALADRMIAVLKYPPLAGEMAARAREELREIRWEKAAAGILQVYAEVRKEAPG